MHLSMAHNENPSSTVGNLFKFTQNVLEGTHSCVFITSDTLDIFYFFLFFFGWDCYRDCGKDVARDRY